MRPGSSSPVFLVVASPSVPWFVAEDFVPSFRVAVATFEADNVARACFFVRAAAWVARFRMRCRVAVSRLIVWLVLFADKVKQHGVNMQALKAARPVFTSAEFVVATPRVPQVWRRKPPSRVQERSSHVKLGAIMSATDQTRARACCPIQPVWVR